MGTAAMLARGANVGVPTVTVRAVVHSGSGLQIDVSGVLLTARGTVRSDQDFVFFNQPRHRSGTVSVTSERAGGTLTVLLGAVEPEIVTVVLAGSVDSGTFAGAGDMFVQVEDTAGRLLAAFRAQTAEPVTTMVFGELYRRDGGWKFRAIGQGWSSGLSGLARSFGISVEDEADNTGAGAAPPPPANRQADWHVDAARPGALRWWDGAAWTEQRRPRVAPGSGCCERCGARHAPPHPPGRQAEPSAPCPACEIQIRQLLGGWQTRLAQVVETAPGSPPRPGAQGSAAMDQLWAELRFHRVPAAMGLAVHRSVVLGHLQRVVTFAFDDGIIEDSEVAFFESEVRRLGLRDPAIDTMRSRLRRGLELSHLRAGKLPRVHSPTLHLDLDEIVHLDLAVVHIRQLASGTRETQGRLVASSSKLRFLAVTGSGSEVAWGKIVEVTAALGHVVISATTAKGGGTYRVDDPEYVAAVLAGTMRVARRLVIAPGARDSRTIPQAVKAAVWQRDGGACAQCHAREYLEFDHVIPHSRGGASSLNNLQLLCRRCNQSKGARL